jgi:hypothetical protein
MSAARSAALEPDVCEPRSHEDHERLPGAAMAIVRITVVDEPPRHAIFFRQARLTPQPPRVRQRIARQFEDQLAGL